MTLLVASYEVSSIVSRKEFGLFELLWNLGISVAGGHRDNGEDRENTEQKREKKVILAKF